MYIDTTLTYSFSYLDPVCCSMSSSDCCFLTCIQISQEAGQVVWYSHLLKNFPQFLVIHTVKGFGIVNKAEIDVLLEFSCFFQWMLAIWSLVPLSFLKPAWTSESSQFTYCWSLAWIILEVGKWVNGDYRILLYLCYLFGLFILFMGFSRQEYWSDLPFPSPVDYVLSARSTMTHLSWVALHCMAHSFIELNKAVVHVIRLVSFVIMVSTSALLTMPKPLTVWITRNCGKFFKRWEYQTTWSASWEICMQVRKQQLELGMEQKTGSK